MNLGNRIDKSKDWPQPANNNGIGDSSEVLTILKHSKHFANLYKSISNLGFKSTVEMFEARQWHSPSQPNFSGQDGQERKGLERWANS